MAKKVKTEKYFMEVFLGDNMISTRLELTKKEYLAQFKTLEEQYLNTCDTSNEFYTEKDMFLQDSEKSTRSTTIYSYGMNDVRLIKVTCKDGYIFK